MSFGWSPGDLVSLSRLCFEIYGFCKAAPGELEGLSDRLNAIGKKLGRLSNILEKSGLGTWKQTPALEQALLDAKAFLEPLRPVINKNASVPSKAKGLARYAFSQDKLKRIEKDLDINERTIDDVKIDLILVCSLRNMQCGDGSQLGLLDHQLSSGLTSKSVPALDKILPTLPSSNAVLPSPDFDRNSITSVAVSNTSKALSMALTLRSQSSVESEAASFSNIGKDDYERHVHVVDDFVADVASLAEATELYSKDVNPTQDLNPLKELAGKAKTFRLSVNPPSIHSESSTAVYRPPGSGGMTLDALHEDILGHLDTMESNSGMQTWSFDQSQSSQSSYFSATAGSRSPTNRSVPTSPGSLGIRCRSRHEEQATRMGITPEADSFVQSDGDSTIEEGLNLQGPAKISLTMNPKTASNCTFSIRHSESSVIMRLSCTDKQAATLSDLPFASSTLSLNTRPRSSRSESTSHALPPSTSRTIHHCFQTHSRPIPHLLHPDVEGPAEEPTAPYTLTFTTPQYISLSSAAQSPHWNASLLYIFDCPSDRRLVCSRLFGKRLLLIAGCNKIVYAGRELAHMCGIALWRDDEGTGMRSVTFSTNLRKGGRQDVEMAVSGLREGSRGRKASNTAVVEAEEILGEGEREEGWKGERQGSVSSAGSAGSVGSVRSVGSMGSAESMGMGTGTGTGRRTSSSTSLKGKGIGTGRRKCVIEFTNAGDKIAFEGHLK